MLQEYFGMKLRELRLERKGVSQEKFALQLEMDRGYYAKIEEGKQNVTIKIMKKLADGLNMTISEMLEGVE